MTGLQTARILADRGIPVIALAKDPDHYCCRTNVCERILFANTSNEEFVETLERFCSDLPQKAVLYPCTDMSVLTLSRNRARLEGRFHVALPSEDVVETMMDKVRFFTLAKDRSLAIPGTSLLRTRSDAKEAAEELKFPCILKPPMKTPTWEKNTKLKVFKVGSASEFLSVYDRCSDWAEILMVQEWVEGTDANLYSYNGYFDAASEPLVSFIARKIRQWPPETGTSCLGEEVRNDVVLEESIRLFRSVGYRGLGYVEMKRDERTGEHFIIEPNIGRPTGRSAIAEAGGVELLYTMYCDVLGLPLPENRVQKYEGVKWISLRRDAQSAFYYWRRGELTLADWWKSWQGRKGYAVWSRTDPAPFWADLWRSVGVFARKGAPRPAAARGGDAAGRSRRAPRAAEDGGARPAAEARAARSEARF
jgi:predicted ATP-grasp superfamily ATP-dependent carboligase